MKQATAEKRAARAEAKVEALEKLIEDNRRDLSLVQQEAHFAYEYLDNIVQSMMSCLIVTDEQGVVRRTNRAAETMLGITDDASLVGQSLSTICDAPWALVSTPEQIAQTTSLYHEEHSLRRQDGTSFSALCSTTILQDEEGQPTGLVCTALDLSERKLLEAQLVQSEKLASIGELAAGVAHEINNPMGFISSNLGTLGEYIEDLTGLLSAYALLQASSDDDRDGIAKQIRKKEEELDLDFVMEDVGNLLSESKEGAARVRKIVQNLREFSHVDREEMMKADINAGVESTLNIAWNEIKYKAEVEKDYGDLPPVSCHSQELNQVIMNILVNAVQAIEEKGVIRIKTFVDGDDACISIADNGCGMPEEVKAKIFDPFYTTKEVGRGTGLGLNLASTIVGKHNGTIEVDSTVGEGTNFTIRIPLLPAL